MLVTVLMPAYNAEEYVGQAIESILNQTYRKFEFIIIDDCSTDRTWKIISQYAKRDKRIVAVRNPKNLKICRSLNKGIILARGKYIARMDADDWSYPQRLALQLTFMEQHPTVGVSGGTMEVCNDRMQVLKKRPYNLDDKTIRGKLFLYSPFCHPATIWRKEVLLAAGLYDVNFTKAEDSDLYFRIGRIAKFGNLPDTLIKYRTTDASESFKDSKRHELFTIYARFKAVMEYKYKMSALELLYSICQLISIYLIPFKLKNYLFILIRGKT